MFREDAKPPDLKELIGKKILMCKKDIKCGGGTLEKGLTYLSMITSDSEYSAKCPKKIKRLKETLTALAHSAAIDMNYEEKVKCLINQNKSRFQGNKTEE